MAGSKLYLRLLLLLMATFYGYPNVVLGAIVEHDAFDAGGIGCRYGLSVTESEEVIPSLSIRYAL